jgi:hypothetical protein
VEQLDRHRSGFGALEAVAAEMGRQEDERRPQPLAAGGEELADRAGGGGVVVVEAGSELPLEPADIARNGPEEWRV